MRLWAEALSSPGALSRGIFRLEVLLLSGTATRAGQGCEEPELSLPRRSPWLTEGMWCRDLSGALQEASSSLPNPPGYHSSIIPNHARGSRERCCTRVSSSRNGRGSRGTQDFPHGSPKELCRGNDTVMIACFGFYVPCSPRAGPKLFNRERRRVFF